MSEVYKNYVVIITPSGPRYSDYFREGFYEKEELVPSTVISQINEFAGEEWYFMFVEFPTKKKAYIVEIGVKNESNLSKIAEVITKAFPDHYLQFYAEDANSPFYIWGTMY
ncbi:MAG: hypothetical protein C5B59_10190 [Bacteroidetes bacterium]|nr:MAG: hypothetical protein C5B59_10190 [Bacteroidota bacterium]